MASRPSKPTSGRSSPRILKFTLLAEFLFAFFPVFGVPAHALSQLLCLPNIQVAWRVGEGTRNGTLADGDCSLCQEGPGGQGAALKVITRGRLWKSVKNLQAHSIFLGPASLERVSGSLQLHALRFWGLVPAARKRCQRQDSRDHLPDRPHGDYEGGTGSPPIHGFGRCPNPPAEETTTSLCHLCTIFAIMQKRRTQLVTQSRK